MGAHLQHPHVEDDAGGGCGPGEVHHEQGRAERRGHQGVVYGGGDAGAEGTEDEGRAGGLREGEGEGAVSEEGEHSRGALPVKLEGGGSVFFKVWQFGDFYPFREFKQHWRDFYITMFVGYGCAHTE